MKAKKEIKDQPRINERIKFDEMQVISSSGENLGVLKKDKVLQIAKNEGLDVVLMADKGGHGYPVVKIMDYGKSLYVKKKQISDAKKRQKNIQIKEVKLRPKIGEHDYLTKINKAIQFIKDGKHVKITIMFKGREAAMRDARGQEVFDRIDSSFEEAGLVKLVSEKDSKTRQFWSRVYYLKK